MKYRIRYNKTPFKALYLIKQCVGMIFGYIPTQYKIIIAYLP